MYLDPNTSQPYKPPSVQDYSISFLSNELSCLKLAISYVFKEKGVTDKKISMLEEKVSALENKIASLEGKVSVLVSILENQNEGHGGKAVRVKARHVRKQKADS